VDILLTLALFVPLLLILWVANLAERKRVETLVDSAREPTGDLVRKSASNSARVLSLIAYTALVVLYGLAMLFGLLFQGLGWLAQSSASGFAVSLQTRGLDPAALPEMGMALWLPALLGLILLLPPVRRWFGHWISGFDSRSPVHAVALSYISLILVNLLFTLAVGLDTLAGMLESEAAAGIQFNPTGGIWAQDVTLAIMAVIGVGWLARRGLGLALARLGIVVPTWRQTLVGLGVGLLMAPVALLVEFLAGLVGFGENPDVARLTEQMIGPLMTSAPGILTLGLAAALGEESIFRGALQPRFGLILTSLLFALVHSNYGLSFSTLLVFLIGLILGLLRRRFNTSTAMLAHATYNMSLGVITFLGLLQNM